MDMVSEENSKRPEVCTTENAVGSGKAIPAKKYSTREYIKLSEDANQYIQDNLTLAKKNIETVKNLRKNLFAEDEGLFTMEPTLMGKPSDVSTTNVYAPINCRFRTHLKESDTANNNFSSIIFSTTAVKPRVTVADLYLKPPSYTPKGLFTIPPTTHPSKIQTRPEDSYITCGNLLSKNYKTGNFKTGNLTTSHSSVINRLNSGPAANDDPNKPNYHRKNSSIGFQSQNFYTGFNLDAFGTGSSNSNAGVMPQGRRSYRAVKGNGENEVFGGKKYFSSGLPGGRVGGGGEYRRVVSSQEVGGGEYRVGGGEY